MLRSFLGRLRDRVTIQGDSAPDGAYAPDFTGNPLSKKMAAQVVSVKGAETYKGRQLEASTDYVITVRYFAAATAQSRVLVVGGRAKDKTLEVVAVVHVDRGNKPARTELHCCEVL